jgi:hypothetical protein
MMRRDTVIAGALLVLFVIACIAIGPYYPDRAFVTWRYADNAAAGHGVVFNAGEGATEGYGNALWLAVCSALSSAGATLPDAAPLLCLLFGVLTLATLWWLVRARLGTAAALAALAVAAATGPMAMASLSGEGVTLTALLMIGCVAATRAMGESRVAWMIAGVTGGLLSTCTHPLALVFPVLLAIRLRSGDNRPSRVAWLRAGTVYSLMVIAFHAARFSVFGTLRPPDAGFAGEFAGVRAWFIDQPTDMAPFGWLYLGLIGFALCGWIASERRTVVSLSLGGAAVMALTTMPHADPLPALASSAPLVLLLATGVAGLVATWPRESRAGAPTLAAFAAVVVALAGWTADAAVFARHLQQRHDQTVRPVSTWMSQWREQGTMVFSSGAGIAYYTGWNAWPVTGPYPPSMTPDVVLLASEGVFAFESDARQEAVFAAAVEDHYRLIASVRTGWTRDASYFLLARADIPELTDSQRDAFPPGMGPLLRLGR